ncbi:unnamed protein product, partial [Rotaria sp. Silwood1]
MKSTEKDTHRRIRSEFPYKVEKLTQISIAVDDNIQLAATIWMPGMDGSQSINEEKFPAILEYLPYRKADRTSIRDEIRLKYLSGFGYVSIRVDIRGTG